MDDAKGLDSKGLDSKLKKPKKFALKRLGSAVVLVWCEPFGSGAVNLGCRKFGSPLGTYPVHLKRLFISQISDSSKRPLP